MGKRSRTGQFFGVYRLGGAKATLLIALQAEDAEDAVAQYCADHQITDPVEKKRLIARPRA